MQWILATSNQKSYRSRDNYDHIHIIQTVYGQKSKLRYFDLLRYKFLTFNNLLTVAWPTVLKQKTNKAYVMLGIIKRNFICLDHKTFIMLSVPGGPKSGIDVLILR